ncbi:MAG: MFS transporter [Rubrivivax sp.]|nr:MFS transporter [Rubrivivax sp.]
MTAVFIGFAVAYFLSALLRAVTATLAPAFSSELGLGAGDLGLLAGAYFFGFALLQLPLGRALDRHGPRRVQFALMLLAVLGCGLFALAQSLAGLLAARMLIGMGVAACLMAPLTAYRRRFSPAAQLRANSWMLMTGSLGMVASTLPVQWLLPLLGWRGLFVALALALALSMVVMLWLVPRDEPAPPGPPETGSGYGAIVRHPMFLRLAPLAFLQYGGMIAVQALWAGPWLTQVAGWTPQAAAGGLFGINLAMLFAFLTWGALMPRLATRGVHALGVLAWGMPAVLVLMAGIVWAGPAAGAAAWAAWCVASTCVSLSQPAVGQAFPAALAGRALSAYNLVIFSGVFAVQWGIGLAIDALRAAGLAPVSAFQVAFGIYGVLCALSYVWFWWRRA